MRTTKLIVAMLTLFAVLIAATPISAQAAPPPTTWEKVMTERELNDHNLSIGVIKWDDSLSKGSVTVKYLSGDSYKVTYEEYYKINDMSSKKKIVAKSQAQWEFKKLRDYAQSQGWWDCKFKIKSCSSTKVTATAKIEYKAVKIDEKSKSITVKMTRTKKKGVWKTTYTVGKKKYTPEQAKELFNIYKAN